MTTSAAVVTNRGGCTGHAAIVARELGIPAVVGTGDVTVESPPGEEVTVSCAEGDEGRAHRGAVPFGVPRIEVADIDRPRTKVMAPSDCSDFAEYLVALGIDPMSPDPGTVVKTTQLALDVERRLAEQSGQP